MCEIRHKSQMIENKFGSNAACDYICTVCIRLWG